MDKRELKELLAGVAAGSVDPETAALKIDVAPISDLGFAQVDNQRGVRQGVSEVIYGEGKTADQIAGIIVSMLTSGQNRILITRLDADKAQAVQEILPEKLAYGQESSTGLLARKAQKRKAKVSTDDRGIDASAASGSACEQQFQKASEPQATSTGIVSEIPVFTYYDLPRVATVGEAPEPDGTGTVVVLTGGTSDIPVAEEAALTAEMLGSNVERLYDVGVAGIHRLLSHVEEISRAKVIVAVAGMEGALASVVAGLVSCPVIAVPTSVGYGASFGGVSALLSMLNSCASGVSVVNIDNGFGAGYQANLINHV
jgi:pyridinium-3,5-biscarboxylic acid mononucleotide synthase